MTKTVNCQRVPWSSFPVIQKTIQKSKNLSASSKKIDSLIATKDNFKLGNEILCFLEELLLLVEKQDFDKEIIFEELYWLHYSFIEGPSEESWIIPRKVMGVFWEFQANKTISDILKIIKDAKSCTKSNQ